MPDFKPMRSVAPVEKFPVRLPVLASAKLDGIRVVKHSGKALTKSLKPIPNRHIARWIEAHLPDGVDGEIISGAPNDEGAYNRTFSAVMTIEGEPEFSIYLFDLHNVPEMYAVNRSTKLQDMRNSWTAEAKSKVVIVGKQLLHTQKELSAAYEAAIANGYEGLITQDPTGFYKYGRATPKAQEQLKWKAEGDEEFLITGCYEAMYNGNEAFINEVGETARSTHQENLEGKGMLGGFFARDVKTGVDFRVAPGKMKHDERIAVWRQWLDDPDTLVGRMGRYRCMGYGEMTNGRPRHGRFYGWRDVSDL